MSRVRHKSGLWPVFLSLLAGPLFAEEKISIEPVRLSAALASLDARSESDDLSIRHPELFKHSAPTTPFLHVFHDATKCGYLFYNQVDISHPTQRYVVQRVKRTIRDYVGETLACERVDYLVEAIRLDNNRLKAPDRHYGVFASGEFTARQVIKAFEIGTPTEGGEEDNLFGNSIYRLLSDYQASRTEFDRVRFQTSMHWTMTFRFTDHGACEIDVPMLGIQLSAAVPEVQFSPQEQMGISLVSDAVAGIGLCGVQIRKSSLEDAEQVFGEIMDVYPQKSGARNVVFSNGIMCHASADGGIKTISLVNGFTNTVKLGNAGVRIGDSRDDVLRKLGPPLESQPKEQYMTYRGLVLWFEEGAVVKLVIW